MQCQKRRATVECAQVQDDAVVDTESANVIATVNATPHSLCLASSETHWMVHGEGLVDAGGAVAVIRSARRGCDALLPRPADAWRMLTCRRRIREQPIERIVLEATCGKQGRR